MSKALKHPDYITLHTAADILGKSKAFVKRAVEKGFLRSTSEPFKSNLNPDSLATQVLVNSQDVRAVIQGNIDLSSLEEVPKVMRKSLPEDMTEFAERFVNLEQTIEQLTVMVTQVLVRLDAPAPKKVASRKETPE